MLTVNLKLIHFIEKRWIKNVQITNLIITWIYRSTTLLVYR